MTFKSGISATKDVFVPACLHQIPALPLAYQSLNHPSLPPVTFPCGCRRNGVLVEPTNTKAVAEALTSIITSQKQVTFLTGSLQYSQGCEGR